MERTAILLTALLVLAIPAMAFAQEPTLISEVETEETGLEGGEDVDISDSTTKPVMAAIGILGKGIAVSPSDPMDFMLVQVGIGAVRVTVDGNSRKAAIGIIKLDGDRYRLREVSVVDGEAKGKLYLNGSEVGSFDLASVEKDNVEVWAGKLELDGTTGVSTSSAGTAWQEGTWTIHGAGNM
jgi:hypothetical protein